MFFQAVLGIAYPKYTLKKHAHCVDVSIELIKADKSNTICLNSLLKNVVSLVNFTIADIEAVRACASFKYTLLTQLP